MAIPLNHAWVEIFLEQMWVCRQVTDVVARTVGSGLLAHPHALDDRHPYPNEPRLNPLDFHGRRRSAAPPVTCDVDPA